MNITLTDGFFITDDKTTYELHDGSTTYYYRNISDALDRYTELVRKKKTNSFDGKISKYIDEIKRINRETTEKILKGLNNGE